MTSSLRRRVERLETAAGGMGSFEKKLRLLAARLETDPEQLIAVAKDYEAYFSPSINQDGSATWEAACRLRDLLASTAP